MIEKNDDKTPAEVPEAPEAPPQLDNSEASAWQSGWESGYAAAIARIQQA